MVHLVASIQGWIGLFLLSLNYDIMGKWLYWLPIVKVNICLDRSCRNWDNISGKHNNNRLLNSNPCNQPTTYLPSIPCVWVTVHWSSHLVTVREDDNPGPWLDCHKEHCCHHWSEAFVVRSVRLPNKKCRRTKIIPRVARFMFELSICRIQITCKTWFSLGLLKHLRVCYKVLLCADLMSGILSNLSDRTNCCHHFQVPMQSFKVSIY